jgi:MFS family permease
MLEVFGITNTELGAYFSVYGIVAMISYLFGGPLADRFPARNLMAVALWLTSLGGLITFSVPGKGLMTLIYGIWGFTTICLFWAALIRATREWGGPDYQGRAFGWLEGGRGAAAALLGTFAFVLFSVITPESTVPSGPESDLHPFQYVILAISVATLVSGILTWYFVPVRHPERSGGSIRNTLQVIARLLGMPTIWLLAVMIICAYSGYKITDDFSLYAREVLGFTEVGAAGVGTAALWIRAGVAILAGYTADRLNRIVVIAASFGLTSAGALIVSTGILSPLAGMALLNLALTAAGIYGIRALYFAVFNEAGIPLAYTGTAVGIICFTGFTPDVFMSPWMGRILDQHPGATGHQDLFLVLALFSVIGLVTTILFRHHQLLSKRFKRWTGPRRSL